MSTTIRSVKLTKKYGEHTVVDRLNLDISAGEVFGLLGPNGAGKTTTILMLLGLVEPTKGSIEVLGLDPRWNPLEVKSKVGYLPDAPKVAVVCTLDSTVAATFVVKDAQGRTVFGPRRATVKPP